MTTATDRPERSHVAIGLAIFFAIVVLGCYCIYQLFAPPQDLKPVLVAAGFLLAPAGALLPLRGWRSGALAVGIMVAVTLLPATPQANVYYGVTAFGTLVAVCFVAWVVGRAMAATIVSLGSVEDDDDWDEPELRDDDDLSGGRRIVGLCGYAKSGKDTAAKGLLWEGDWTHASFAKKIKDLTLAINPLVSVHRGMPGYDDFNILDTPVLYVRLAEYVEKVGLEVAKDNPEVRQLLQRAGTDGGRKILGDDVWVDAAMEDLPAGNVVFTDVRFPNEAAAIQAAGGYVIRVHRPGYAPVNPHASEIALDGYPVDFTVINDGTRALVGQRLRDGLDGLATAST